METKPDKAVSIIECDMNVRSSIFITDSSELFCCVLLFKCLATRFLRWILMLRWVTKSLNDDLSTRKNRQ